jgi:hypothetical protein
VSSPRAKPISDNAIQVESLMTNRHHSSSATPNVNRHMHFISYFRHRCILFPISGNRCRIFEVFRQVYIAMQFPAVDRQAIRPRFPTTRAAALEAIVDITALSSNASSSVLLLQQLASSLRDRDKELLVRTGKYQSSLGEQAPKGWRHSIGRKL